MKLYHEGIVGRYRYQMRSSLIDSIKWDCMYDAMYLLLRDKICALIREDYPDVIIDIPKLDGMITYVEDESSNKIVYSMDIEFVDKDPTGG